MRVLFIPPYSLPVATGGFESQVYHIFYELRKAGIEIDWLSFENVDINSYDIVHLWSTDVSMIPPAKLFHDNGVPIVITPMAGSMKFTNLQLRLFHFFSRFPLICQGDRSVRYLYRLSDFFFPLTLFERNRLSSVYSIDSQRMAIIPNGIDEAFFNNRFDPIELPFSNYLISIGRIEPNKNQLSLIKAVNRISANLVIVGADGTDYNYVKKCKKTAGNNVLFWGREKNPFVLKSLYKDAIATVIASHSEMAPLTAFESISMGTPVLCTKKSGIYGERVGGITFTGVSASELSRSIKHLLNSQNEFVKEGMYSWRDIANRYIQEYKTIIERNALNQ